MSALRYVCFVTCKRHCQPPALLYAFKTECLSSRHRVDVPSVQNAFPDILVVIQVALEGAISRASARAALAAGTLPQGDLLPWMIGQQFQDPDFPGLSGARVVRIASHPNVLSAGYGGKAMAELEKYFSGGFAGATGFQPHCTMLEAETFRVSHVWAHCLCNIADVHKVGRRVDETPCSVSTIL